MACRLVTSGLGQRLEPARDEFASRLCRLPAGQPQMSFRPFGRSGRTPRHVRKEIRTENHQLSLASPRLLRLAERTHTSRDYISRSCLQQGEASGIDWGRRVGPSPNTDSAQEGPSGTLTTVYDHLQSVFVKDSLCQGQLPAAGSCRKGTYSKLGFQEEMRKPHIHFHKLSTYYVQGLVTATE
ncbi:Mucin-16 [Manis pentadactyla]|nr:Mucin-16 [Manis pentadactyla]